MWSGMLGDDENAMGPSSSSGMSVRSVSSRTTSSSTNGAETVTTSVRYSDGHTEVRNISVSYGTHIRMVYSMFFFKACFTPASGGATVSKRAGKKLSWE